METKNVHSLWKGLLSYKEGLCLQQKKQDQVLQCPAHVYLIGLEHPSVITMGLRAEISNEILQPLGTNVEILRTERGGLATAHNPGQLVIYPILSLKTLGIGAKDYVQILLSTTVDVLKDLGISSHIPDNDQGVYTDHGKICFCGVRIKNKITSHGISINNHNDLTIFNSIRPCGFRNLKLDQVHRYHSISSQALFKLWCQSFSDKLSLG